jgi:hypothetical protein
MTTSRVRALAAAGLLLLAAACRSGGAAPVTAAPLPLAAEGSWAAVLAGVRSSMDAGLYARADSALEAFVERQPGTPEAAEARYWRAIVHLDPKNPDATPRTALAAIDAYLAGGAGQPHFLEALVLRRTASMLEASRRPVITIAADTTRPATVDPDRLRAAEDTIRQLRAELERTQGELERIRRRIRPSPPPR